MSLFSAMWDYVPVVPTLLAIVNSVIAVWMAQFKPESQRLKVGLLLFAIVAGLAAAGATIAATYHVVQSAKQVQAENAQTLATLGDLIEEGDKLLAPLRDQSVPVDNAGLNAWAAKAEKSLLDSASLGPAFVRRFRDASGLLHGSPNVDEPHQSSWNGVYERITRLQEFSAEMSSKPH
jgi:hypothetical protein